MTLEPKLRDVFGICQRDKLGKSVPGREQLCDDVGSAAAGEADDKLRAPVSPLGGFTHPDKFTYWPVGCGGGVFAQLR